MLHPVLKWPPVQNWKTSLGGVLLLTLAAIHTFTGIEIPNVTLPSLNAETFTRAWALLMAKDGTTHSNLEQVKKETQKTDPVAAAQLENATPGRSLSNVTAIDPVARFRT